MTNKDELFFEKCKQFKKLVSEMRESGFIGYPLPEMQMGHVDFASIVERNDFDVHAKGGIIGYRYPTTLYFTHDGIDYIAVFNRRELEQLFPEILEESE